MPLVQPIADLKMTFAANTAGQVVVDVPLTSAGDFALVTGINRLVQDIARWLLCPSGQNPFQPQYGNPFYGQLRRPLPARQVASTSFLAMLEASEAYFLQVQATAAAQGTLSLDEQVDHFENQSVDTSVPGTTVISFVVVSKAGTQAQATVPIQSGPQATAQ